MKKLSMIFCLLCCGMAFLLPTDAEAALSCQAGKYIYKSKCYDCDKGYYRKKEDKPATQCNPCPAGTRANYSKGATNCIACGAGKISAEASTDCTACTGNTYTVDHLSCLTPPENAVVNEGHTGWDCKDGYGEERYDEKKWYGTVKRTRCTQCAAGTAAKSGDRTCKTCPAGTYANASVGASECKPCPFGTYSSAAGSTSCTKCPAGTYSDDVGATSSATCKSCTGNQYSYAGSAVCVDKPSNSTVNSDHSDVTCYAGSVKWKNQMMQVIWLKQPDENGMYRNETAHYTVASCSTCAAGKYAAAGDATCSSCEGNTYSYEGSASCSAIPGNSTVKSDHSGFDCKTGYVATEWDECSKCPDNCGTCEASTCHGAGRGCTPKAYCASCKAGYELIGDSECRICPAGRYAKAGSTSCTKCPAGTASAKKGATSDTECKSCTGNTYSDAGASSCTNIPSNSTVDPDHKGFTCHSGYYKDGGKCKSCSTGCTSCTGSSNCSACKAGYTLKDNKCIVKDTVKGSCPSPLSSSDDGCCCIKK